MSATRVTTLFSLAAVKAYLAITSDEKDAVLVQLADAVSERIESSTGRVFVSRSLTDVLNGDGTQRIALRYMPVQSITSLTIKDSPDSTPVAYTNGTDFDVDNTTGLIRFRNGCVPRGFQNVTVTYVAGWAEQGGAALPADVYQAGLDYVKVEWNQFDANAIAATSVSLGPSNFLLKPGLPYSIKAVLDDWRVVRV